MRARFGRDRLARMKDLPANSTLRALCALSRLGQKPGAPAVSIARGALGDPASESTVRRQLKELARIGLAKRGPTGWAPSLMGRAAAAGAFVREGSATEWIPKCDLGIVDAPYSATVHGGQSEVRKEIGYDHWTPDQAAACAKLMGAAVSGWALSLTCHRLGPAWAAGFEAAGRYVFAPIPVVCLNAPPRMSGDGPASAAVWLIASRPRQVTRCGSLPGYYTYRRQRAEEGRPDMRGVKDLDLMRRLVRDYAAPGDLVGDICAGWGQTTIAALAEGHYSTALEFDPGRAAGIRRRVNDWRAANPLAHLPAKSHQRVDRVMIGS